MCNLKERLHTVILERETKTRTPGCLVLPINRDAFEELAAPFYEEAYGDGLRGENRGAWERFADGDVPAAAEAMGNPPPPPEYHDILHMIWQVCRIAWYEGRLDASKKDGGDQ